MKINHWFSENFKKPESMIDFGHFSIWITGEEVQIECTGASGTERMFTDIATLDKFFGAHKQELVRRSNGVANTDFNLTQPAASQVKS